MWPLSKILGSTSSRTSGLRRLWQEYDKLWNPNAPQSGNAQTSLPSILAKAILNPRSRGMFSPNRLRDLAKGKRFYLQNGQVFQSSSDEEGPHLPGPVATKDDADLAADKRTSNEAQEIVGKQLAQPK